MENDVKTQWHPAFCSSLKLELRENAEHLTYTEEYNINSKPLLMDMLIVKKSNDVVIKNDIGKLFRGHNIIEYKSPDDTLNLDTFVKVIGYACLYKANELHVDEIRLDDITITLIRKRNPSKLLKWLRENGFQVTKKFDGIYYVSGEHVFPVQIIVTGKLSQERQKWLTLLNDNLGENEVKRAVMQTNQLQEKGYRDFADSVLQVVLKSNKKRLGLLKEEENMCQALRELMAEEIEAELKTAREKAVIEGLEAGRKEGLEKGKKEGLAEGRAEGRAEGILQSMLLLVKKNLLPADIAAKELGISLEEFSKKMAEN